MAVIDPESELFDLPIAVGRMMVFSSRWLHGLSWKTPLKMFRPAAEDGIQFDHTCDPDISYIAQIARDRALAQRLAAAEQKFRLDFEFARRLQEQGGNATDACNADSLLGRQVIDDLFASDPNKRGKDKMSASTSADDLSDCPPGPTLINPDPAAKGSVPRNPTCGICKDHFQETHSPLSASLSANSSTHLPFGLQLPCPNKHSYCVGCLSQYITSKLDPLGTGRAPEEQIVFPIRCPECPLNEWADGIQDDVAERILTKDRIALWYDQKQLDSHPRYFCPNRKCSALVQLHEQEAGKPQVSCSLCKTVMCVRCKTQWHNNLTCTEYQALPADERSPEDRLLIKLAKEKKWRRCKTCGQIIELTTGCCHMTCICGNQFCFVCGANWVGHDTCVPSED
ncbi:hypothetical protein PILCRDRAFT_822749 [Piloderma croceum F 1598]|uniref:RBR-type E3 ubiquitin transferase n=1 Tax=Piloderma croceum (strain F 1598) TaxID=765440 RepID=A0A0C3F6G1_PILCF|nr:hypothetical protein PILCRDRAFT_822749 [Piloderma croceum F 1598]